MTETGSRCRVYGIRNCDTMKKTFAWLDSEGVAYEFIDYKKSGVADARLPHWNRSAGWQALLNRRGLMWKKLGDADRADVDERKALQLMAATPTLIRRPVIEAGDTVIVGFDPQQLAQLK